MPSIGAARSWLPRVNLFFHSCISGFWVKCGSKMFLSVVRRAAASDVLKSFVPLFDRVLVERFTPEVKTKGGIMLPEKAQGKVLEATVVAAGQGARTEKGEVVAMNVKVGDRVLLPEYGGTKVVIGDKEYSIFRESDILGKFN